MTHVKYNREPMESNLNYFVNDLFFRYIPMVFANEFNKAPGKGSVPVNVKELANGFQLEIVAPGFDKGDFKINIEGDLLTISAQQKKHEGEKQVRNIRTEYSFGTFKRSFTLEDKIDATKIEASYINGVLVLNLPAKEEVKAPATEITIK